MTRDGLVATLGPIRQIAWLAENLDAATAQWRRFAGVGAAAARAWDGVSPGQEFDFAG